MHTAVCICYIYVKKKRKLNLLLYQCNLCFKIVKKITLMVYNVSLPFNTVVTELKSNSRQNARNFLHLFNSLLDRASTKYSFVYHRSVIYKECLF